MQSTESVSRPHPPGNARMAWLIAQRAALESLHDRMSLLSGLIVALPLPAAVVLLVVRPLVAAVPDTAGTQLLLYLLLVGLFPAFSAVGIAAGQFAGEKERDVLTPLLATPASNLAIFGGKVLGAILPPLLYAALAITTYLVGVLLLYGGGQTVRLLPPPLAAATILLVPAVTCFAAVVVSLISSRVRTYNAAQQLGGLVLLPVWGLVSIVSARLGDLGAGVLLLLALGLFVLDALAAVWAAATWRREEVLAQR